MLSHSLSVACALILCPTLKNRQSNNHTRLAGKTRSLLTNPYKKGKNLEFIASARDAYLQQAPKRAATNK